MKTMDLLAVPHNRLELIMPAYNFQHHKVTKALSIMPAQLANIASTIDMQNLYIMHMHFSWDLVNLC